MEYDFTSVIDRHGMDALAVDAPVEERLGAKVEEGFDLIPMWVADMNFPTCPAIPRAIMERAAHPLYGYFMTRKEYYDAIIGWQTRRNGASGLEAKHIGYENGVLGGVVSVLNVLCSKGDKVLVHSPTYIGFTRSLENNGWHIVGSPLVKDADGVWRMDYADMEKKVVEEKIHAAILCSPHNPMGRVWERWELEKAMEIFERHGVWVISDEIWSDLILGEHKHIPTQSVTPWAREHTAAMYAPSKTFNLAGLIGAYHIIYNDWLRERVEKESSLCHYNSMNVLSMHALMAAYGEEGAEWTDQLCRVLTRNADLAVKYIEENFHGVETSHPEGAYMLFLNCAGWCAEHGKSLDWVLQAGARVGVAWQDGRPFHGPCHIRMNLALPTSRVEEAFHRLDRYVFNGIGNEE